MSHLKDTHTVKYLVSLCIYHLPFLFLKSVTITGEVLSGLRENFLSKLSAFHKTDVSETLSTLSYYEIFYVKISELQVPPAHTVS